MRMFRVIAVSVGVALAGSSLGGCQLFETETDMSQLPSTQAGLVDGKDWGNGQRLSGRQPTVADIRQAYQKRYNSVVTDDPNNEGWNDYRANFLAGVDDARKPPKLVQPQPIYAPPNIYNVGGGGGGA